MSPDLIMIIQWTQLIIKSAYSAKGEGWRVEGGRGGGEGGGLRGETSHVTGLDNYHSMGTQLPKRHKLAHVTRHYS